MFIKTGPNFAGKCIDLIKNTASQEIHKESWNFLKFCFLEIQIIRSSENMLNEDS